MMGEMMDAPFTKKEQILLFFNLLSVLKQQALNSKKQILLLVIFLIITLFLLYKNFWSRKIPQQHYYKDGEFTEEQVLEKEGFISLSELIKRLFQEDKFESLKPHGELPVEKGKKGRSNPFIPF